MDTPAIIAPLDNRLSRRLSDAVVERSELAFNFLERLVAAPSTVGNEAGAQRIVGEELARLKLTVTELAVPEEIAHDPVAGVAPLSYAGRANVYASSAPGELALLINGHVDVVPANPLGWTTPPWTASRREGWLFGRGAGDMKGGIAMATLALDALRAVAPSTLEMPVGLLSAIEEECTGHGTLAALRQGIVADLVIVAEPTDLNLLIGGTGIVWVDVTFQGSGGHAEVADRVEHPLDVAMRVVPALEEMGRRVAREHPDGPFGELAEPYNVNVGLVRGGDWRSSVASVVTLGVRFGHPRAWTAERAIHEVEATVRAQLSPLDSPSHGPAVSFVATGFRAQGYLLDDRSPLATALATVHQRLHATPARTHVGGSTTDARFYLNQGSVQALCYGPVARQIHGVDEAVELASIVKGAQTLAHFIAGLALARGSENDGARP
ncbi:MAG: M20/M25/M40 family metallo-hydrolase [Acidimicrobiales bacterium]|jgi:acetylornithine deacetylase